MASLDVLSLSVGQDGLSVSVPGDGGKRHSTAFTLQLYHCVQQGCDFCGDVTTFDGGGHWRNGIKIIKSKTCNSAVFGQVRCVNIQRIYSIKRKLFFYIKDLSKSTLTIDTEVKVLGLFASCIHDTALVAGLVPKTGTFYPQNLTPVGDL